MFEHWEARIFKKRNKMMFNHLTQFLRCSIILASVITMCLCNFKLSESLFNFCRKNFLRFAPTLLLAITVISLGIYVFCVILMRIYSRSLFTIVLSKNAKNLESLSLAMSGFKERQYRKLSSESLKSRNLCLICYEFVATTTIQPCQHQAMCARCAWKYVATCLKNHLPFTCIICRTIIKRFEGDTTVFLNPADVKEVVSFVSRVTEEEKEEEVRFDIFQCSL